MWRYYLALTCSGCRMLVWLMSNNAQFPLGQPWTDISWICFADMLLQPIEGGTVYRRQVVPILCDSTHYQRFTGFSLVHGLGSFWVSRSPGLNNWHMVRLETQVSWTRFPQGHVAILETQVSIGLNRSPWRPVIKVRTQDTKVTFEQWRHRSI